MIAIRLSSGYMNIISANMIILTTEDDLIIDKATMEHETTQGVSICILLKDHVYFKINSSYL